MSQDQEETLPQEKSRRGRPSKVDERNPHHDTSYRASLVNPDEFLILNKRKDRAYRMVSKRLLDKGGGIDRRGWIALTEANSKGERLGNVWGDTSSGTDLRNGDLVAAFMPLDRFEARKRILGRRQQIFQDSINRLKQAAGGINMRQNINVDVQRAGRSEFKIQEEGFQE